MRLEMHTPMSTLFFPLFNSHFKKYINIIFEFVPQILFLMCLFGWLVFLIFFKWCYHYENPNTAPSLLITLINMFLEVGQSPHVNATTTDPTEISENEYSVFGPTESLADMQVYTCVGVSYCLLTSLL